MTMTTTHYTTIDNWDGPPKVTVQGGSEEKVESFRDLDE